jgi:hypothetical protein
MSSAVQLGDDEDDLLLFQAMASISHAIIVENLSSGKDAKGVDLMKWAG